MESTVNEKLLKFKGTLVINDDLDRDCDYTFGLTANIQDIRTPSNNDGTYNKVFVAKLIGDAVIQNKWGKNIKSKAKGSPSQKLRNCIIFDYEGEDRNQYYEQVMTKILANWQDVKNFLETL